MKPQRIQLRRTKGWRMPENTVKVDRSTRWGNPYRVGMATCGCRAAGECRHNFMRCETPERAVYQFKNRISGLILIGARDLSELRGKNLACWCPLDQPCHADILLDLANE